ncbi:hypothetical protein DPSP01_014801 [Paraphaeosphaeria sporulosa]
MAALASPRVSRATCPSRALPRLARSLKLSSSVAARCRMMTVGVQSASDRGGLPPVTPAFRLHPPPPIPVPVASTPMLTGTLPRRALWLTLSARSIPVLLSGLVPSPGAPTAVSRRSRPIFPRKRSGPPMRNPTTTLKLSTTATTTRTCDTVVD